MNNIKDVIIGANVVDARAAFYYLGRYLKQAAHYDRYRKDFFEDDFQSSPSKEARKLTLMLIQLIEEVQGKKAADLTDDEYLYWVREIGEVESSLDPELTDAQMESVYSILDEIAVPSGKEKLE